jgi:DnaK suppressor protein
MNNKFVQEMKDSLLSQKHAIITKSSRSIEVDTDGDETDEIQANVIIEIENQLETRDLARLKKINEALDRIDDKSYGICQDCDEEIPEKRLMMNPYFITCVLCSEEREMELRQKGKM